MTASASDKLMNILVIDDDEFMVEHIQSALKERGYTNVQSALNGKFALNQMDTISNRVDLILCDLNMPKMDGIEFLRHLVLRKYTGGLILFSGENRKVLNTAANLAKEHYLNLIGVIKKPFSIDCFMHLMLQYNKASKNHFVDNAAKRHVRITPEDIQRGIDANEFILYYQPQIRIQDNKLVGFEALIRWQHPKYGFLVPFLFIHIAEESEVIHALTQFCIKKLILDVQEWRFFNSDLSVSINFPIKLLSQLALPDFMESCLQGSKIKPSNVVIEITETGLNEDLLALLETSMRLSLKGFSLSIDDFGTGYSSMKQLQQLPFSELKIDRIFVHEVMPNSEAEAILEASVLMARKLGIQTVAEGVETQEDWDTVKQTGCDIAQGYFIAKPMPTDELHAWVKDWK